MAHGQEVFVLQEVLYVHGLARNLVSVAAASCIEMTLEFKGTDCLIRSRTNLALPSSHENHHMYLVSTLSEPDEQTAMMTSLNPNVRTWHRQLGHSDSKGCSPSLDRIQPTMVWNYGTVVSTCVSGKLTQESISVGHRLYGSDALSVTKSTHRTCN